MFSAPRCLCALLLLCGVTALTACGAPFARRVAPTTVMHAHDLVSVQRKRLLLDGYSPVSEISAIMPDGSVLRTYTSICKGSADGHCQSVDVFVGAGVQRVLHRAYTTVQSVQVLSGSVVITSPQYSPTDPLCCPSGRPKVETWKWTGRELVKVTHS